MVQVTYQGGGMDGVTSNAASEATLQLLLKALSGQGGAGSGAQDAYNKAQKAEKSVIRPFEGQWHQTVSNSTARSVYIPKFTRL